MAGDADVLGRSFRPDEDHHLPALRQLLRLTRGEDNLADGSTGRAAEPLRDHVERGVRIDLRVKELLHLAGVEAKEGLILGDEPLLDHIDGNAHGSRGGPLSSARLEHVERAVLDGEFQVLHIPIMRLQRLINSFKLLIRLRHYIGQTLDRLRCANSRHNILPLGVDQEFPVELPLPRRRVAREGNARRGRFPQVAENHSLDVHRRPPVIRDAVDPAIGAGALGVPGIEHGVDRHLELVDGDLGEVPPGLLTDEALELFRQRAKPVHADFGVEPHALAVLEGLETHFEIPEFQAEDDVSEHRQEPAVAVVREAVAPGAGGETPRAVVVETEVEHGVHHSGHGNPRARPNGNEQGVLRIAELRLQHPFQSG
jgi:hypothetical protein